MGHAPAPTGNMVEKRPHVPTIEGEKRRLAGMANYFERRRQASLERWENLEPALRQIMAENGGNLTSADRMCKRTFLFLSDTTQQGFALAASDYTGKTGVAVDFAMTERALAAIGYAGEIRQGNVIVALNCGTLEAYRAPYYGVIKAIAANGGYSAVRKRLGLEPLQADGPESLWKRKNREAHFRKIAESKGGQTVRKSDLDPRFRSAMYKNGETLGEFALKYGMEPERRRGPVSYMEWENLLPAIRFMMEKERLRLVPGWRWEGWKRYGAICAAMKRNGGLNEMRETVGVHPPKAKGSDFFRKFEAVERALETRIAAKGRLPPIEWFASNPKYDELLASISEYHGDFWQVRKRLEERGKTAPIYRRSKTSRHARLHPSIADGKMVEPVVL